MRPKLKVGIAGDFRNLAEINYPKFVFSITTYFELENPLVNKRCLLEKYPGKGGWTYTIIEEITQDKRSKFGWAKVKGSIDDYQFKNYKLMPLGNGKLFLPVRAEIRKKINKQAGDFVHVVLFADHEPLEIPEEFLECLQNAPLAYQNFLKFTEGQQKAYIDWIYEAKTDKTKIERISKTLTKLEKGQKFYPDNNYS